MLKTYNKTFAELVQLYEAPLKGFEVLPDSEKIHGPHKKRGHGTLGDEYIKDIQTAIKQPFKQKLKTKMRDIPYPIYIYQMSIPALERDYFHTSRHPFITRAEVPEYYHRVDKRLLAVMYGEEIANQIKILPETTTMIYRNRSSFPTNVWGFLHDFVHGITLSEVSKEFYKIDNLFIDIGFEINNMEIEIDPFSVLPYIMTTTSAKKGYLTKRPEEATTELMTQWLFSKKIEFDWSTISDSEETDRYFERRLSKVIPVIEKIFWKTLMNAKGKAYITA